MKTKLIFIMAFVAVPVLSGQTINYQSNKLHKMWEVDGLSVPESVFPVMGEHIMYVSNIGSKNSSAKDGNGFISILTFDGKIKTLKWVTGLNAPKGMGILKNTLYVSDVDRVVGIDRKTGKKISEVQVPGSKFLNDIAIDNSGIVYVSDSRTGSVFKIQHGKAVVLVHSGKFSSPNGLIYYNGKLLLGTGDRVVQIDTKSGKYNNYITNTGAVDGLAIVQPGEIIVSDWAGKVQFIKKTGQRELLLDSSKDKSLNAADFGYIASSNIIYIPTFFGNSVVCYQIKD